MRIDRDVIGGALGDGRLGSALLAPEVAAGPQGQVVYRIVGPDGVLIWDGNGDGGETVIARFTGAPAVSGDSIFP